MLWRGACMNPEKLGIIVRIALYNFLNSWVTTAASRRREEKSWTDVVPLVIRGRPHQRRDCNSSIIMFYYPTSCTCLIPKVGSTSDILQTIAIAVVQFFESIGSHENDHCKIENRLVWESAIVPSRVSASVEIGDVSIFS